MTDGLSIDVEWLQDQFKEFLKRTLQDADQDDHHILATWIQDQFTSKVQKPMTTREPSAQAKIIVEKLRNHSDPSLAEDVLFLLSQIPDQTPDSMVSSPWYDRGGSSYRDQEGPDNRGIPIAIVRPHPSNERLILWRVQDHLSWVEGEVRVAGQSFGFPSQEETQTAFKDARTKADQALTKAGWTLP